MKSKFGKIPIMTSFIGTFSLLTLLFVSQTASAQETFSPEFEEETTPEFAEETTSQDAGTAPEAGTAQIVYGPQGVTTVDDFVHANEAFDVQWSAVNVGTADSVPFTDRLIVTHWPESGGTCGTPGQVVYDSQTDASDPTQFDEAIIPANTPGPLMVTNVGPFPEGTVKLAVTLGEGVYDVENYNCMNILAPE